MTTADDASASPSSWPLLGLGTCVAGVLGVALAMQWPALPLPAWSALVLLLGALAWWRGRRGLRVAGALLALAAWAWLLAGQGMAARLPAPRDATLVVHVLDLPEREGRRLRFHARVLDVPHDAPPDVRALAGRALDLAWYDAGHALAAGETWRLPLRLRPPRGLLNPGGADAERRALERGIVATGHVRGGAPLRLAEARGLAGWRGRLAADLEAALARPGGRIVRALALGDVRGLDERDWDLLRALGLTHLVAISGFHVGLVAGAGALAARLAWWLLPWLGLRCPRTLAGAIAAAAAASGYTVLAGAALPTVRTALMIAVALLARLLQQRAGGPQALALAALALLVGDPLAVLAPGFWLSVLGVGWLMLCVGDARGAIAQARGFLRAQWVASLGLLPLGLAWFGQLVLLGPLVNLVAIPLVSLALVPACLLGAAAWALGVQGGEWVLASASGAVERAWPALAWLAERPGALWWGAQPPRWALPLALLGLAWWLAPRGLPARPLGLALCLPLLWPPLERPGPGQARIDVLDVGQGNAVLVRTAGHALLVDAGPAAPEGVDLGQRVVLPALRALGVRRLDALMLTHHDADHAGGAAALLAGLPVTRWMAPEGAPLPGAVLLHPGASCEAGQRWDWDGVRFTVLHPTPGFPYLGNDSSCVLRVEAGGSALLLTGDIGGVVEARLRRLDPGALRADVVLAPHHGSAGSSSRALVVGSGARVVLVSAAHGRRGGLPRPEALRRWRDGGASAWGTGEGGALTLWLPRAPEAPPEAWRARQQRLWHASGATSAGPAVAPAGMLGAPDPPPR